MQTADRTPDTGGLPPFPSSGGLVAFRLVYRVESRGPDGAPTVIWEERLVRRPFDGRITGFSERPSPDSEPSSGAMSAGAGIFLINESGDVTQVAGRVHGPAIGDFGFVTVLDDLVREHVLVDRRETDQVLNRSCRLYRSFEPPSISLKAPTSTNYDDLCIDSAGIVLRERWVFNGEVTMLREAVDFEASPRSSTLGALDDAAASVASPPGARELLAEPDTFLAPPVTPDAFTEAGRFEYVPDLQSGLAAGGLYRTLYWVFVRGADYIVVEAGTGMPPISLDEGRPVEVDGLGTARLMVGGEGSEARVDVGSTRWVHVRTSAPLWWLERYLTTLRLIRDGTGIKTS